MYILKILTILFVISCYTTTKKVPLSWNVYNVNNFQVEELFIDSILIEKNFYKNKEIDSFRLLTRFEFNKIPIYTSMKVNPETMKSYYSCYFESDSNFRDSIKVAIWMPVERLYSYNYKIFKDDQLVWEISDNTPIIKFRFPFSPSLDTGVHKFRMERTITKDNSVHGIIKHNLWIEKKRKILYNQFAENLWDK